MKLVKINLILLFVLILFYFWLNNKKEDVNISITNKFVLFYDELKYVAHFESNIGYVLQIENKTNNKIIIDTLDYYFSLNHDILTKKYDFIDSSYFRYKSILNPKSKKKILLGSCYNILNISDTLNFFKNHYFDTIKVVYHYENDTMINKKMIIVNGIYKTIFFVDGKITN